MNQKIIQIIKNPLWIIVILLIIMNFLLWDISQRRIRSIIRSIDFNRPYFNSQGIIDKLDDIYWKLR